MARNSVSVPPLRILQLNSLLNGGGTDDRATRLMAGLHARGHEVAIAGPPDRVYAARAAEQGVRIVPTRPTKPVLIVNTARELRRRGYHVLQAHHGRDYWPAVLAAGLSGIRPALVLVRHLAKSPGSWLSRRYLLSQCDAMVGVSQFVADVLRKGAFEPESPEPERRDRPPLRGDVAKITAIRGAFDLESFRPRDASPLRAQWELAPGDLAFGVVGSYDRPRGKGQREFLLAARTVAAALPRARFLIIGRGNLRPTLEADIQRLGLTGVARLTPWCDDMPSAMNALDCLVHPQVGTEALPGVIIEAHACGRPVIATTIDGNPEAFHTGGLGCLIPPESVDALAQAMIRVAGGPEPDLALRRALHDRVVNVSSTEAACRNYEELYLRLDRVKARLEQEAAR